MKFSHLLIFLTVLIFLPACLPSAASYNNRGNQEYEAKNYDQALENYTLAKREDPDVPEPYYNAGSTFHRKGDFEAASAQTQQSLRTAQAELAEQSYYNLGNSYFKMEDWAAAIDAYKEALRLKPDDLDAKHNLELAMQQQQQQQQQQQGQGQQQQEQQGGGQNQQQPQQGQQGQQQQQQGGGSQDQSSQSPSSGSEPQQQPQQPRNGTELSPEEAEQLLDGLGQNSQTLQERLNQTYGEGSSSGGFGGAPKPLPEQDW